MKEWNEAERTALRRMMARVSGMARHQAAKDLQRQAATDLSTIRMEATIQRGGLGL